MLAPINTNKHYFHRTNISVGTGTVIAIEIVDAVTAPAVATAGEVRQGAVIKAIMVEFWLWGAGATGVDTQFNFIIEKVSSGQASVTAAQIVNLGAYPNKKNVFFYSQGVIGAGVDGAQAIPVHRAWMLIPKGKQRMGLGDKIVVSMEPIGSSIQLCGFATYKEYT